MDYLSEILSLVEAGSSGDRRKAVSYASLLADKLENAGEAKAALRLRRILAKKSSDGTVVMNERVPVDSESRLSLADEVFVSPDEAIVFFDQEIMMQAEEFIAHVEASDRLLAAGIELSPSLLVFGPPGCGKSELAKYIAARLALPLITARIDTLVSSFLGSTSKNLRLLFDHVAARPCVLFLDEFDAIAKLRDDRQELGELKRVVVSLLQNLDKLNPERVLIAATNHEHLLDPAIWRRFAYKLNITLPGEGARGKMFARFLDIVLDPKSIARLARASEGLSGSDIKSISDRSRRVAVIQQDQSRIYSEALKGVLMMRLGGENLSVQTLIGKAKDSMPDIYTHRVLADMFEMTPGNITHILHRRDRETNNGE